MLISLLLKIGNERIKGLIEQNEDPSVHYKFKTNKSVDTL